ncbi:ChrR family anti-sigma-E factor [Roseibium sp.]|uniref:ChrR family anti-sigma-E factor n=1 Tax=Roseibium sp. TaxID=1936156 RepID=UPI003BA8EBBD
MRYEMEKHVTGMDELLAGYAAGTLTYPAQALIGAHLELSGQNRGYVQSLETLASTGLADSDPVEFADRDSALAAIFESEEPIRDVASKRSCESDGRVPESLRSIIGPSMESVAWKTLLPGVKECKLGEIDGCDASLIWVRAGRAMPSHTHHGTELTLVLQGGFKDTDGHYVTGDVAFADDDVDHRPIADDGDDCICFAVTAGRLELTGPVGRWFAPFMRG